jgi:hypothetical protein
MSRDAECAGLARGKIRVVAVSKRDTALGD